MRPIAGFRLGFISVMAAIVGMIAGVVAFLLYNLIGLFTNLAFYHVWSFHFRSPAGNQLGARGVSLGDEVRVNYRTEDEQKIAFRIEELSSRQKQCKDFSESTSTTAAEPAAGGSATAEA